MLDGVVTTTMHNTVYQMNIYKALYSQSTSSQSASHSGLYLYIYLCAVVCLSVEWDRNKRSVKHFE